MEMYEIAVLWGTERQIVLQNCLKHNDKINTYYTNNLFQYRIGLIYCHFISEMEVFLYESVATIAPYTKSGTKKNYLNFLDSSICHMHNVAWFSWIQQKGFRLHTSRNVAQIPHWIALTTLDFPGYTYIGE